MVVNIDNILHGWQRWEGKKIVDTYMGLLVKMFQPKRREDLSFPPDANGKNAAWPEDRDGKSADPWQFFFIVLMKDVDSGQLFTFSTSSQGGRSAHWQDAEAGEQSTCGHGRQRLSCRRVGERKLQALQPGLWSRA